MSASSKELRKTMPGGFIADTGALLTIAEVESRPNEFIPIDELSDEQKRKLTLASLNHAQWTEIFDSERHVTKEEAIAAVNDPDSALGNELVHVTMMGYAYLYKSFLPHDDEEHPHDIVEVLSELESQTSLTPVDSAALPNFTMHNNFSVTVFIYKQASATGQYTHFINIQAGSDPVVATPDYPNQTWKAYTSMPSDPNSNSGVMGCYRAYPGCTTWEIASFSVDTFVPSVPSNVSIEKVYVNNNLKTYINVWKVRSDGSLYFINVWPPASKGNFRPSSVGRSYVATQGSTVISKFFIDNTSCTTWTIESDAPPGGEEIYASGNNNYIFYQVNTPEDDTVAPIPKKFTKQISISPGTTLLYASLFDAYDAYFSVPEGVKVSIMSIDSSGTAQQYNTNTNTDSLYIQMTPDGQSLHKLCVKNPTIGQWTITIEAITNTPVYFQFQTVPTKDPYTTMQATLSPADVLGSKWEGIAYAGFTNIANMQSFDGGDEKVYLKLGGIVLPLAVAAIGVALVNGIVVEWSYTNKALQNDSANVKEATNSVCKAVTPSPSGLGNLLLVDANGADKATQYIYSARKKYLYPTIESGKFRKNYLKFIGEGEATKENFVSKLLDPSIKYVSVAGHGNFDRASGYTESSVGPWTPILLTKDVTDNPNLAKGKIFHCLTCRSGAGLGPALVQNGAIAFIGYKVLFQASQKYGIMVKPDCIIDQKLLSGKTVNEAVTRAKAEYTNLINECIWEPTVCGYLQNDLDGLVVLGDGTAKLLDANQSQESPESISELELHDHDQAARGPGGRERKNGCCNIC